jgi:hypothetical protein
VEECAEQLTADHPAVYIFHLLSPCLQVFEIRQLRDGLIQLVAMMNHFTGFSP